MPRVIVQKYGGTSVGSLERINRVADNIKKHLDQGDQVAVVVSAMGGETDKLEDYAHSLTEHPSRRELDVLLSSGEQVSGSLLAIALHHRHIAAHSYMGWQIPIKTDQYHTKARILSVSSKKIKEKLDSGYVTVITGFQGVAPDGEVTTLGRGGSDTTAVAVAASIKAEECQIYTDVDGIYTADPRVEPRARLLEKITFEEMMELAGLGSKVLHSRSVNLAAGQGVTLRVLSSFKDGISQKGTLVVKKGDEEMEKTIVSGIAHNKNEAKITVSGVPDKPGMAAKILQAVSNENLEVDMIVQNISDKGNTDFTFTVHRSDYKKARQIVNTLGKELGAGVIKGDTAIAKVSVVGLGMKNHSGVAAKMFTALANEGINIQIISTSEIKVSVIVEEKYLELAVRCLHKAFNLHQKAK